MKITFKLSQQIQISWWIICSVTWIDGDIMENLQSLVQNRYETHLKRGKRKKFSEDSRVKKALKCNERKFFSFSTDFAINFDSVWSRKQTTEQRALLFEHKTIKLHSPQMKCNPSAMKISRTYSLAHHPRKKLEDKNRHDHIDGSEWKLIILVLWIFSFSAAVNEMTVPS